MAAFPGLRVLAPSDAATLFPALVRTLAGFGLTHVEPHVQAWQVPGIVAGGCVLPAAAARAD